MKKTRLVARCVDCVWQDQIDKKRGFTSLTWFCPKSGLYVRASKGSMHARRKCVAFVPKTKMTHAHHSYLDLRKIVQERYRDFLQAAAEGEQRCFDGKRWNGHIVLILVDATLDSIGLNYFQIIVPRVRRFYGEYVKTRQITSLETFSILSPHDSRLRRILNNERAWRAAINICEQLNRIKKEKQLESDFAALRFWAERASYENWREDPIGKIAGVGLITFQYLRMQAGVDTTVPDKIIKRVVERDFGIKTKSNIQFIKKMEVLSKETRYSQTLLCWAIWLKEAGVKTSNWERINQ